MTIPSMVQKMPVHPCTMKVALQASMHAPTPIARFLTKIPTKPLKENWVDIHPTSDAQNLPGYWISPGIGLLEDIEAWEQQHFNYDIMILYCHGGAFVVGHALMYASYMRKLVRNPNIRVRIYTLEYVLPKPSDPVHHYPYQHTLFCHAYKSMLEKGVSHEKIVLGGDSSGGFNALKAFQEIIETDVPPPAGILLNSPLIDLWLPKSEDEARERLGPNNSVDHNSCKDWVSDKTLQMGMDGYHPPHDSAPTSKGLQWFAERIPKVCLVYGTSEVLRSGYTWIEDAFRDTGHEANLTIVKGEGELHIFNVLDRKYSKKKNNNWDWALDGVGVWLEGLVDLRKGKGDWALDTIISLERIIEGF